ncbi:hypothetical protein Hanom_Chr05g00427321 [Helianthus anomalus]
MYFVFRSNYCIYKTSTVMKFYFYTCLYELQYLGYALPISNAYAQLILDILIRVTYTCLLTIKYVFK